jgi:hypothetical protein
MLANQDSLITVLDPKLIAIVPRRPNGGTVFLPRAFPPVSADPIRVGDSDDEPAVVTSVKDLVTTARTGLKLEA